MDIIDQKNKLKDIIILTLIDSLAEVYSYNSGISKDVIKDKMITKLDSFKIIDIDKDNINLNKMKDRMLTLITDDFMGDIVKQESSISLFNNYQDIKLIGSGGFSNVYQVFNDLDNNKYAIKKIGILSDFYETVKEIRTMAILNHPNIVRYYTSWIEVKNTNKKLEYFNNNLLLDKTNLNNDNLNNDNSYDSVASEYSEDDYDKFIFIQMELCKEDLKTYLSKNKLSKEKKMNIINQIIDGLKYIHENEIFHRDLKLSNIFIGNDNKIKIGDFGLATKIYDIKYDEVGTYGYIAPEILSGSKYSYEADYYSLGVIILEIMMDFNTNMEKVLTIQKILDGKIDFNIDNNIKSLILKLININPNKRKI